MSRLPSRVRARSILALLLAASLLGGPTAAFAAAKGKKTSARTAEKKPAKLKEKPVTERTVTSTPILPSPSPAPTGDRDEGGTGDAAAATTTAGGKTMKTKTYTFGAMDVEGKLKTPQLLYFLNRVKLELDMSAPDKRSFMKELAASADDKNL